MVSLRIQLVLPIRNSQKSQYEYNFRTWSRLLLPCSRWKNNDSFYLVWYGMAAPLLLLLVLDFYDPPSKPCRSQLVKTNLKQIVH